MLGLLYNTTSNHSKSVYVYQKLIKILEEYEVPGIDFISSQRKIADSLISSKKFNQAKPYIQELLKIEKSSHLLMQFSKICIHEKNYSEAKSVLLQVIVTISEKNLEYYKILSTLAWIEIELKEYINALEHLNDCIEIMKIIGAESSPEMLWVYSQIGQIYYTNKQYEEALNHLKMSKIIAEELQIRDTEYGNTLLYIGKIKLKQHNLMESLHYLISAKKVLESIKKEDGLEAILAMLELYLTEGNTLKS